MRNCILATSGFYINLSLSPSPCSYNYRKVFQLKEAPRKTLLDLCSEEGSRAMKHPTFSTAATTNGDQDWFLYEHASGIRVD